MADLTPAATLRAAATKLRETASNATPGTRKVGRIAGIGHCVSTPDLTFCVAVEPGWVSKGDIAWIALMHPKVAEHLAAWLEREARNEEYSLAEFGHRTIQADTLALARSILGRTS